MNVLFVVDSLSDVAGANVNIVRTLSKVFKERNCCVTVLAKSDIWQSYSEEVKNEFDHSFILPSDNYLAFSNIVKSKYIPRGSLNKYLWLLGHPGVLIKGLDIKFGGAFFTRMEYTKMIEKICRELSIDAVIGVSSPYYICRAVSKADVDSVKSIYQLDPYTNNFTLNKTTKPLRKVIERQTANSLDFLFVPDFILNDFSDFMESKTLKKCVLANIPGIILSDTSQHFQKGNTHKRQGKNTVDFVFAGKLYETIRNPKPLLELFCTFPNNYRLHILGSGCEKEIQKYVDTLGEKLIYHGLVSKDLADHYVKNADVLVNIDNSIKNQMPSKIIDYICQQKKLINICLDRDCLAAKILSGYVNGINVCINENSLNENSDKIIRFVEKELVQVPFSNILKDYNEYTDCYVADTIINSIKEIIV